MENDLQAIVIQSETILSKATTRADWEQAKASILGPNGSLTRIAKDIGKLPKEDRPAFGQALNQTKKQVESLFKSALDEIEAKADLSTLGPKSTLRFLQFLALLGVLIPLPIQEEK